MSAVNLKLKALYLCATLSTLIVLICFKTSLFSMMLSMYRFPRMSSREWYQRGIDEANQIETEKEKSITFTYDFQRNFTFKFKVYRPMRSPNQAALLVDGCSRSGGTDKLTFITGFIDLTSDAYRKTLGSLAQNSEENDAIIEARHMEVIDVLNLNLDHPLIGKVHVLVRDLETAKYLHLLSFQRSDKLVIRVVSEDVGLKSQLLYAARCLPGQLVAITNQDNKIGKGWDLPWHRMINDSNTMYALTRHSALDSVCSSFTKAGTCDDGETYFGSHDTFVLKAKEQWTEDTFSELRGISPDLMGMENLFIWFFQTKMRYRVLNPCKVLFVHHHHCISIRGTNRKRVNVAGKSGTVGFSYNLGG